MNSRSESKQAQTTSLREGGGASKQRRARRATPQWAALTDDKLLNIRLCDLKLSIEGGMLERRIQSVLRELRNRGIAFRPHFWLSNEWFTPDGVPGVAAPFYLAHSRLMRLEKSQMLEIEGGTHEWGMKILRHEIGHAIDNAYRLGRRPDWRKVFGDPRQPYPDYYVPRPYSKKFVLHLDYWYAQSHPAEDFAETFALWLRPGSQWRKRYAGWPAIEKLEYVDSLMNEIAGTRPQVTVRRRTEPLSRLRYTLRRHYRAKRARYGKHHPDFYDRDLRRLFSSKPRSSDQFMAARFLRRVGPEIRRLVSRWTGEYQYTIDRVLEQMIERCRELNLWVDRRPQSRVTLEVAILLTIQTMNFLHSGRHRVVL